MDAPPPPGGKPTSSTRLYLGNLPPTATKADIENHFASSGSASKIMEVKLMTGFGFVEYEDTMDARDAVDQFNGSDMMGSRLTVQFARGGRPREQFFNDRPAPRTRRTIYRMNLSGLPAETSWQDLKDFARLDGLDVVYSEISRDRDGKGFVEYETEQDLQTAVDRVDGNEFKGAIVQAQASIQAERPEGRRSRSPRRGGYGGGGRGGYHDDYERRGPPRGGHYDDYDRRGPPPGRYGDRGYRERSPGPPRRDFYDDRRGYGPPPRRGGPPEDYPPPRRGGGPRDDDYPPPPRGGGYGGRGGYADDPYANGGGRGGYDRPPSPRGPPRSPPGGGRYDGGYDREPRRGGRY